MVHMQLSENIHASVDIESDENAWVRSALDGDSRAFEMIMRRYNQRLYRLALSVLGDRSEAQDVLQESYVRAFYQLGTYSQKAKLGAWLARIVRNEAIDRVRARTARNNMLVLEAELTDDREVTESIVENSAMSSPSLDPEATMEQSNMRGVLEHAIQTLPEQFRTVFMLREVEGLSIKETAEYLGIPAATVKTRDHRARTMLRERLEEHIDTATKEAFSFLGAQCDAIVFNVLARVRN
jgi:RNA polymerase sigma-70 factor (ECF subfamily)